MNAGNDNSVKLNAILTDVLYLVAQRQRDLWRPRLNSGVFAMGGRYLLTALFGASHWPARYLPITNVSQGSILLKNSMCVFSVKIVAL